MTGGETLSPAVSHPTHLAVGVTLLPLQTYDNIGADAANLIWTAV